ncbi:MAG: hypothetical protein ACK5P6_02910 [Pseudobdellovibrionaceae bacterium]
MDIKNALNAVLPIQVRSKDPTEKTLKMGNTTDRDGHGQQQWSNQKEQEHPPMSEEQFQKALQFLRELPAVKDHHLEVSFELKDGKRVVYLKEPDGKLLRRILEAELWTLQIMKDPDSKKGQLLSKTA